MAFVSQAPASSGFGAAISAKWAEWKEKNAKRREYRQTVNSLEGLSDRSLRDLGLHRSGIQAAAYEAVYHN